MAFDAKACLFLGPKGVGKTSATYFVAYSLPESEFLPVIFKEPPESLEHLAFQSGFWKNPWWSFISKPAFTRDAFVESLRKVDKKIVFFIDEAHLEKNKDMYMEFKYLLDDVPNLRMVVSALSRENFPDSLLHVIGEPNVFSRNRFSAEEMTRILQHRIRAVGGNGLKPFSPVFLKGTFSEQNLLSPRYVFDELNAHLASLALGDEGGFKGVSEGAQSGGEQTVELERSHASWWPLLSPSQQGILELLIQHEPGLTLQDIMQKTQLSQNTAFNALYQLRGDDAAEKKRKPSVPFPLVKAKPILVGARKKNVYVVVPKVRNLFTTH